MYDSSRSGFIDCDQGSFARDAPVAMVGDEFCVGCVVVTWGLIVDTINGLYDSLVDVAVESPSSELTSTIENATKHVSSVDDSGDIVCLLTEESRYRAVKISEEQCSILS